MEFILLKGKEDSEQRDLWCERIRSAWTQFILYGKGCSHLPMFQLESGVERCVTVGKCMFEMLLEDVYVCPRHFTLHCCMKNDECNKNCQISWNGRQYFCRVSLRDLQQEEMIAMDFENTNEQHTNKFGPVIFTSYIKGTNVCKKINVDDQCEKFMQKLRRTVYETIAALCDVQKRNLFDKWMIKKQKKKDTTPYVKDLAAEILISRDVLSFAQHMLIHVKRKPDRYFLLKNQSTFIYFLLLRYTKGLQHNTVHVLKTPPYASIIIPLPKKTLMETIFCVPVPKMSKCIHIIQSSLESMKGKQHCLLE